MLHMYPKAPLVTSMRFQLYSNFYLFDNFFMLLKVFFNQLKIFLREVFLKLFFNLEKIFLRINYTITFTLTIKNNFILLYSNKNHSLELTFDILKPNTN